MKNINELETRLEQLRYKLPFASEKNADVIGKEIVELEDKLYLMNGKQNDFELGTRQDNTYTGECESCS